MQQQSIPIPEPRERLPLTAEALALFAVAAAPLAIGAVHLPVALSVAALGCLALILLVVGLRDHRMHLGWLAPLLFGVNAATVAQMLPLPPDLVEALAPETAALYAAAGNEGWHPLSLDPAATAAQAAKGIGWLCLFAVLQHRATASRRARRRVLYAVAGSATVAAIVGLGHWFAGEERSLLGLYEFSSPRRFLSTLGNTNNLSGFLNLGGLVALGLAAHAQAARPRALWTAAFVACVGASILTASRGGAMALLAGLLLLPIVGRGARERRARGERESWRGWATIAGATAAASLVAWWLYSEYPRLLREIATVLDFDPGDEEGKLEAWRIAWDAARVHPIFGIGRGAFESVHALYLSQPWRVTFTHAENEPLQAIAELGFPVGALLVGGVFAAWIGLLRRGRLSWAEAGAAAGAFALLLQNLVDFSLQFAPGLALLALFAHRAQRPFALPRAAALSLALAAPAIVLLAGGRALPGIEADRDALIAAGADPARTLEQVEAEARAAWAQRPAWYLPAEVAATRAAAEPDGARRALPWINELLRVHPQGGSGHRLAGEVFAKLGRRGQALGEFRIAASLGTATIDRVLAHWPGDADAVRAAVPRENAATLAAVGAVERAGDRALAIELLERLRKPDARVLTRLFWLRRAEGDHEGSLAVAERLEPIAEKREDALVLQGRALLSLGRRDEARARFEAALAIARRHAGAIFGLADLALAEKRPDDAIDLLDRILVTAPAADQRERHWRRAQAFRQKGELLRARDELRLALALAPDNRWYRVTLAGVLLDLGRLDEAEATLEPLGDWSGADATRARLAKMRAAKSDRALELLEHRLLGSP